MQLVKYIYSDIGWLYFYVFFKILIKLKKENSRLLHSVDGSGCQLPFGRGCILQPHVLKAVCVSPSNRTAVNGHLDHSDVLV